MSGAREFLALHWLSAGLLAVALLVLLLGTRRPRARRVGLVVGAGLGLLAVGGLVLPAGAAWWVLVTAFLLLAVLAGVLALTGAWWPAPAWVALVLLVFGAGGRWLDPAERSLEELGRDLRAVEFVEPYWLLLLGVLPLLAFLSWPRLNRIEVRPWLALGLRCLLIAILAVAMAEPRLRQASDDVTVLFVIDRSLSVPEEPGEGPSGRQVDRRARRLLDFINNAVQTKAERDRQSPSFARIHDRAGLIVFGRRPRLELPPSDVTRWALKELPAAADGNQTDIAAALKLALASFPEGSARRIVLASDGNETLGSTEEQGRLAQSLGVQIDVIPLAAGRRNEDEVLVERVDAPPVIEQGAQVPIRVLVRSYNRNVVVGKLTVKQITEGEEKPLGEPLVVKLRFGLNPFAFSRPVADEQRSYTYEAEFEPLRVESAAGKVLHEGRPPGDRVQNNRAAVHVMARGRRRVLLLEGKAGDHRFLADHLAAAGKGKLKVIVRPVSFLQGKGRDELALFLSGFDCVVLANVAADQVSLEHQEVLRANTHEQGCGLVMIGGPDSYGAGGWQNTPVEKALPVDSEIKSLKVEGKGGLVLIMHASEMPDGNLWQKRIAKLAVERLGPADEVGVIDFDFDCKWHVPLQRIGTKRALIMALIDKMEPGDMPDFDPALKMAAKELTDPRRGLATKHVIIISDGDPQFTPALLPLLKNAKITVSTVGVACHGPDEDKKMADIAKATKGRAYSVKDPRQLPAIYIKESRVVSQSFVHEQVFRPLIAFRTGPTDPLPDPLPVLRGYVRTTPKPSPLVEVPLVTPRFAGHSFPLLAFWHYGLGKSVAFASDAGQPRFWSRAWAEGGGQPAALYTKFWEQVLDWSLRPTESRNLTLTTEYRDGKVRVTVEARTPDEKRPGRDRPDTGLRLRGGITMPGQAAPPRELRFVQKNSGVYEVEVKAEEAGTYFITAQATRLKKVPGRDGKLHEVEEGVDSVRSGVTLPYSPEFAVQESNTALLERLREVTGGRTYADDDVALGEAALSGEVFRPGPARVKSLLPLWHWLVFVCCGLLLADVAVRRLALDPRRLAVPAAYVWARLRGWPVPESAREQPMDRLHMRRPQPDERAARRFEGGPVPAGTAPPAADAPPQPAAPAPAEAEAEDYASRLLEAKRRALEERNKGNG